MNHVSHPGRKNNRPTPEYRAWQGMRDRCYNKNSRAYKNYGGRGIIVCERWLNSFANFFLDMGAKPSPNHSLDRHPNNDGNYEPSNCRWATRKQQAGNRRNNHLFELKSGQKLILSDLAKELGVSNNTIHNRLNSGKSVFKNIRSKLVLDTQTGEFFNSAKEAASAKNIEAPYLRSQLSNNCKNKTSLIYVE